MKQLGGGGKGGRFLQYVDNMIRPVTLVTLEFLNFANSFTKSKGIPKALLEAGYNLVNE